MTSDTGDADRKRWAKAKKARWLRGIGYVTRPLVFLLGIGGWIVLWYVWLARAPRSDLRCGKHHNGFPNLGDPPELARPVAGRLPGLSKQFVVLGLRSEPQN